MLSSSKAFNVDLAKKEIVIVNPSANTTTSSTAFIACTGWTLTIPKAGMYTISAEGSWMANEGDNTAVIVYVAFYKNGVIIPGTTRRIGFDFGPNNMDLYTMMNATLTDTFSEGDVISLWTRAAGAGDASYLYGTASGFAAIFKAVMETAYVTTTDLDNVYSTSETDTGKTWIDGKTIYRKVIDFGAPPNATTKSLAHGITGLDKIIPGSIGAIGDNGALQIPFPRSSVTDNECVDIYIDNTNIVMNTWSATYTAYLTYVTLEYTKV
ncbi:MAG TPA: hypothetical protein VMV86_00595 [Methanosarcinales archaeon]|nr:hypothetical protein [Methanosarcinales archaeon]